MDSTSLTEQQAEVLRNRVGSMLGYVGRLQRRMQLLGWPCSDPLYQNIRAAEEALHALHVRLIYLAAPPATAGQPSPNHAPPQAHERPLLQSTAVPPAEGT